MNVLLLAKNDWAGLGNTLTKCLCEVGVNAKIYTIRKNRYNHPSVSINKKQAIKFSRKCDIIQYMHSEKVPFNIDLNNKKVVVFHGGGKYRNHHENLCRIFNPIVDCSIIQTYDLFGLGAKNEIWLLPPIDTQLITPNYETNGKKIIIGHFPSSSYGKGTKNVNRIIEEIKPFVPPFEYRFSDKRIKWNAQISRMSEVDIYIERMSMTKIEKNGKLARTGVWGMTALEAAALGKIVVTNFYGRKYYKKDYGECVLQSANSEDEMKGILIKLLNTPKKDLLPLKQMTRKWVEEKHSFEVIGNRLRSIYERI